MKCGIITVLAVALLGSWIWTGAAGPTTAPTTRPAAIQASIDQLLKQLGADDWQDRQKAQDELVKLGEDVVPDLRKLLKTTADEEVRTRVESALREIWTKDKTVARIQEIGGKVVIDDKAPAKPVVAVDLRFTQSVDADLEHFKGLTGLQSLDLDQTRITDGGLEHLEHLTSLQTLDLMRTAVTDAGLERLKGLTSLQRLDLRGTRVTDSGLEHLAGMSGLQVLDLMSTKVTDAGLMHLKGLTSLKALSLRDTKVTDAGVKNLQRQLPDVQIQW